MLRMRELLRLLLCIMLLIHVDNNIQTVLTYLIYLYETKLLNVFNLFKQSVLLEKTLTFTA